MLTRDKLTTGIGVVVTAVWAASFICDIVMSAYDPSPYIHLTMMAIVGSLFGKAAFDKSQPAEEKK